MAHARSPSRLAAIGPYGATRPTAPGTYRNLQNSHSPRPAFPTVQGLVLFLSSSFLKTRWLRHGRDCQQGLGYLPVDVVIIACFENQLSLHRQVFQQVLTTLPIYSPPHDGPVQFFQGCRVLRNLSQYCAKQLFASSKCRSLFNSAARLTASSTVSRVNCSGSRFFPNSILYHR